VEPSVWHNRDTRQRTTLHCHPTARDNHPARLNHHHSPPVAASIVRSTSQNSHDAMPRSAGSGRFMPNTPVLVVRGPNSVATMAGSRPDRHTP